MANFARAVAKLESDRAKLGLTKGLTPSLLWKKIENHGRTVVSKEVRHLTNAGTVQRKEC